MPADWLSRDFLQNVAFLWNATKSCVIVDGKSVNNPYHMVKMLELLKWQGYERASLAVQKANYAVKMYKDVGFKTVNENAEEYIMVCEL